MSDPYRFDTGAQAAQPAQSAQTPYDPPRGGEGGTAGSVWVIRAILWAVFAICLALNAAGSIIGLPIVVDAIFGAGALASVIALAVHYWKARK